MLRPEATNGSERIFNIRKKNQIHARPVVHHFYEFRKLSICSPDQPRLNIFSEVARARRQSFFDTSHQKWSEWKTNRSAVIAGRFRRQQLFPSIFSISRSLGFRDHPGGGSLKPSHLEMEKLCPQFAKLSLYFGNSMIVCLSIYLIFWNLY